MGLPIKVTPAPIIKAISKPSSQPRDAYYYDIDNPSKIYTRPEGSGKTPQPISTNINPKDTPKPRTNRGGGGSSSGPTPLSTSSNVGGGSLIQNPLSVANERLNTQMNQPNQFLINKIVQDRQTQIRQGQTIYNQGRSFNQLNNYEKRGTSSIQQTTFSDEQLLKMPFGSGESEFLGRQSAQSKSDVQRIYDKEASILNEEVQTRINEVTQGIQEDINNGKIGLEEGQSFLDNYIKSQEKYFNTELENRSAPQVNNILTSRSEAIDNQLKESRSFWSGRGMAETGTLIIGGAPTAAALGGIAALGGGAVVGIYGAYSLGKSALDYGTGKKSLSQLPQEAAITASSLLIGGGVYKTIKGKAQIKTTTESQTFMGLVAGERGGFVSKSEGGRYTFMSTKLKGKESEGLSLGFKPDGGNLNIDAGLIKTSSNKGSSGSISSFFGSPELGKVSGEVKAQVKEGTPFFNVGLSRQLVEAKSNIGSLGLIDTAGLSAEQIIIKGIKNKPRMIPENYQSSNLLGFIRQSPNRKNAFDVVASSSPGLMRIYKSGKVSVLAKRSSFNIFGRVYLKDGSSSEGSSMSYKSFQRYKTLTDNEMRVSSLLPQIRAEPAQISTKNQKMTPITSTSIFNSEGLETSIPKIQTIARPSASSSFKTLIAGINDTQEKQDSKTRSSTSQRKSSGVGSVSSFGLINSQDSFNRLGFNLISEVKQDQSQRLNQAQKMKLNQELSLNQAFGFGTFRPGPSSIKTSQSFREADDFNKREKGYKVEVKTKKGYLPISNKVYSYGKGFSLGSGFVDRTTSRTFRLIGTNQSVKAEKGDFSLMGKFRTFSQSKGVKRPMNKTYIEKSRFALDIEKLPRGKKRSGFFRL